MRSTVGKLFKSANLIVLSFVLATSGMSAAVPLFLSQNASAISGVTYSTSGFDNFSWGVDRSLPSGGHLVSGDSLSMTVDGDKPGSNKYEGLKAAVPAGTTTISADLLVDPSWAPRDVIAGMWGQATNGAYADNAWPTLEFNNVDNEAASVDVWDTFTGDIKGVTTVPYGSTINLEIAVDPAAGTFTYYLNGTSIFTSSNQGYKTLTNVIFNNYNNGDSYTTVWTNFRTGKQNTSAPVNLAISHNGTKAASGTAVGPSFINGNTVLNFDPVADTNAYVTEVTTPNNTFEVWNGYNNTWLVNGSTPSQGEFSSHGDGMYAYRVKARSATTGLWSNWSNAVSLTYDSKAPTLTSVTANGLNLALDGSTKVSAKNGITFQVEASDVSGFGYTYVEMNKNLNWQAASTGAASTTLSTAADKYIDGQQYGLKICPNDKVGNGACTQAYFTIDNTMPSVAITSPHDGAVIRGVVPVTSTVTDAHPSVLYVTVTNNATHALTTLLNDNNALTSSTQNWNTTDGSTPDGTYTVYAEAKDLAGNDSSTSIVVTVDNTAPTITLKPGFVGDATAKIFSNVSFSLYDANQVDKYVINDYTSDFGNNKWSDANFQNIKSHLLEGNNVFALYDVAGNSTTYEFAYDAVAPAVTINAPAKNSPTITGTIDDYTATVSLSIDSTPFVAHNNGDGTWVYTLTTVLSDGTHNLKATGTDIAGNTTAPVATGSIVVSTAGPVVNPNVSTPSPTATTPQTTDNNLGTPAVLGAQTAVATTDTAQTPVADALGAPEVKGVSDQLAASASSPSSTGLAWYWWVLIVAAAGSFIWWSIARLRNRANQA